MKKKYWILVNNSVASLVEKLQNQFSSINSFRTINFTRNNELFEEIWAVSNQESWPILWNFWISFQNINIKLMVFTWKLNDAVTWCPHDAVSRTTNFKMWKFVLHPNKFSIENDTQHLFSLVRFYWIIYAFQVSWFCIYK